MQHALDQFQEHCKAFIDAGVCSKDISLPRQHALLHYIQAIHLFGLPNGLCSSITKSKHIRAIKWPYWRSSRYKALRQILKINQHLEKISASRHYYLAERLPISPHYIKSSLREIPSLVLEHQQEEEDAFAAEGDSDSSISHLKLCQTRCMFAFFSIHKCHI